MMQPRMAVAWSHGREERRGRGGGYMKKKKKKKPSPQSLLAATRGLGSAETMATFHTDEGFFFTATAAVNQAGQGEMAATHAMPLLKGGGREAGGGGAVTECSEEKQTKLSDLPFIWD